MNNLSDYASRHPSILTADNYQLDDYVSFVTKYPCPNAISIEDIKEKTKSDKTLLIKTNNWYQLDKPDVYPEYKNADIKLLKRYARFRNELTATKDNDLILKGNRIVMPKFYHKIPKNWLIKDTKESKKRSSYFVVNYFS